METSHCAKLHEAYDQHVHEAVVTLLRQEAPTTINPNVAAIVDISIYQIVTLEMEMHVTSTL